MDDSFPEFLAMQGSEPLGLDAGDGGMPPPPRVDTTAAGVLDLMRCQVVGCPSDLVLLKEYHQRYKICETHLKQPEVMVNDELHRFCQQCGRFHVLEEFDDNKRSCRERLRKHNERRRKKGKEKLKGGEEHVGIGRLVGGGLMLPAEFLGDSYSKRARAEGAEGGYYSDCSTRCTGSSFASSMDSKDSLGSYFGNRMNLGHGTGPRLSPASLPPLINPNLGGVGRSQSAGGYPLHVARETLGSDSHDFPTPTYHHDPQASERDDESSLGSSPFSSGSSFAGMPETARVSKASSLPTLTLPDKVAQAAAAAGLTPAFKLIPNTKRSLSRLRDSSMPNLEGGRDVNGKVSSADGDCVKVQPRTHSNLGPRPNFGSPIPEEEAHYHTVQGATFHGSGGGGLEPCPTQVFMGSPGGSGQDWALEGGPGTHSASHGQVGGSRGAGVGGPAQEWVGPRSLTAGEWAAQVTEGRPSQSPPIHRMMTVDRTQLSSHTGRGSPSLQLPTTPCSQDGSARGQGGIAQGQGGLVQGQGGNFYPLRPESAAGGHRSHEQQQRPRTPLGGLNLAEPPLPFMRTAPPQGSQLAQGDQHYTQAGQSYSPSQGGYMKEEEYADRRVLSQQERRTGTSHLPSAQQQQQQQQQQQGMITSGLEGGVRAAPHGSVMQPPFLGFTSLLMDPVVEQNHPNRPAQVLIHTQDHAQGGPGQMGHAPAPSQYQDHVQGGPGQMGHAPTPSQYQDHVQGGPGQMGHALVPSQYQDHVQGGPGQMGHALAPSQYQDHVQGGPGQMGHAPAPSQYVDHLQGGPGQMGHAPAPSQYHALEYHTLPPNPRESSSNIPMTSSDMLQQNYQNRPNYHNQQNYQTTAVQQPQQWDTLDHMGSSVSGRQAASPLGWEPNTLNEYGGNNYQQ